MQGKLKFYSSPFTLSGLTEDIISNSVRWFDKVSAAGGSIGDSGMLIYEAFCMVSLGSIASVEPLLNLGTARLIQRCFCVRLAPTCWHEAYGDLRGRM